MASATQVVTIVGGLALVAVIAGGVAYFAFKGPARKPAEPAPVAAAPQESKPPLPEGVGVPGPNIATLEFEHAQAQFTTVKPTAAYVAPSPGAPPMYPLPPGVGIRAIEQSKDGKWVVALTENGQAAYLPSADLGPFQPGAADSIPNLADHVTGPAEVLDTATLEINGQRISLFGVIGETGALADGLQDAINSGPSVTCSLRETSYVCLMQDGSDVARVALFNGAARPGPDATDDYRQVADAAMKEHRGIWKQ
jgi:hypothetical protein